ncbi:Oidioi.mRNA.OKI2018_I69.chr1.g1199.t1.cds [Oikopleura dioica]|uniref:Oidioi.mRNA.OKI2018_I69.chr1.g1199.t1.cds n=1 Tax=Oikopleura dioica TaxID=34765 RepID=A0ABN7SQS6_OIKDI|nr:Oidioi.mRNA.OKI2018_I69.chr1.g1199.t1.cds [Oikopleura dioica]
MRFLLFLGLLATISDAYSAAFRAKFLNTQKNLRNISRRGYRSRYRVAPRAAPAYYRIENKKPDVAAESELLFRVNVLITPGGKFYRARSTVAPEQLSTKTQTINLQRSSRVIPMSCRKTTQNSKTLICDRRTKKSRSKFSQEVVNPYRFKKYSFSAKRPVIISSTQKTPFIKLL